MADEKRDMVDDVIEGIRRLMKDLDRLLNPGKYQKRVPVPVRINPDRRDPRYNRQ